MDIAPDKQNLDSVFSNTTFYIDFYQREYKWGEEPVKRLLDDLFYKFDLKYAQKKDLTPSKETVTGKYPWYYLNTYVTNTIEGRVYVVDGQQRLTTLSLIIIVLKHLAVEHDSKLLQWIDRKIAGHSGFESEFWMNHEAHKAVQAALFEGDDPKGIDVSSGVTAENLVANYEFISKWLRERISDKHKLETFVFYLLYRVVLINLEVEQTDVPMVFEVINDRGVRLKPYEILKGKLLGQIDKIELAQKGFNELWEKQIRSINNHKEDEADSFFRGYLKAKYSDTRKDGQRFDGEYHRVMFDNHMEKELKFSHSSVAVKEFLDQPFRYYSRLYERTLCCAEKYSNTAPCIFFNRLNDLDSQFMLLLAGCALNDPAEDEKIAVISCELDRFFTFLHLQNAYDSNRFIEKVYEVSAAIRNQPASEYRAIFDRHLKEHLSDRRNADVTVPIQYTYFKNVGIGLPPRFKRYFFARIEKFLADNMNLKMKHPISDLVSKTGAKTGFHIEHILAHNDENLKLFGDDEDRFEQERNRLGGILLLKGRDNISSNDEIYENKLKSYANTLYWNETLREDSYKSKLDMRDMKARYNLNIQHLNEFGPEELEDRQKLLYAIVQIIWK